MPDRSRSRSQTKIPWSSRLGLGVRVTTSHHKNLIVQKQDSLRIEKNGCRFFRRLKLTMSCNAEGQERRKLYRLFREEVS
jgi:hypothetical protein